MPYVFNPFTAKFDYTNTTASTAGNADTVDGFHASQTPTVNTILPLDSSGNLTISKADPELRLTDTGNSQSSRWLKTDTTNYAYLYNQVLQPQSTSYAVSYATSPTKGTASTGNVASATTNYTYSFWLYPTRSSNPIAPTDYYMDVIGHYQVSPSSYSLMFFHYWNNTTYRVGSYFKDTGGSGHFLGYTPSTSGYFNNWHHIVYSFSNGRQKIFCDGVLMATDTVAQNTISISCPFWLSARTNYAVDGRIDEVAVWSRTLTDGGITTVGQSASGEVGDLYNNGNGFFVTTTATFPSTSTSMGTNIWGIWHCDANTGTSLADTSGLSRTLNLTGTYSWVTGKTVTGPSVEAVLISSKDGTGSLEKGIQTYGDTLGRHIVEGSTIKFNIGGVEQANIDANGDLNIGEGNNIIVGTTTGTKIGTAASQKIGFYNATPIVQPSAYTQTYSTAARTNPNVTTTIADTTTSTQSTPWGYATQTQADSLPVQINALQADLLDLKKLVNALIDDHQALGLAT